VRPIGKRSGGPFAGRTLARSAIPSGKYFPIFFLRDKIEGVAELDTTLSPELKAGR
jgi:hypothetical protein